MSRPRVAATQPLISTTTMNGGCESDRGERRPRQHRGREGTGTEEGDVAEVEQTGQADDDVQAHRRGGEDDHLGGDRHVRVGAALGEREGERDHEGRQDRARCGAGRCSADSQPITPDADQHRDESRRRSPGTRRRIRRRPGRGRRRPRTATRAITAAMARISIQAGASAVWRFGARSAGISLRADEGQQGTDERDPAAVDDVDQSAELDGDAERGSARCRPARRSRPPWRRAPSRPAGGARLDQIRPSDEQADDQEAEHERQELQRRRVAEHRHVVQRDGGRTPRAGTGRRS